MDLSYGEADPLYSAQVDCKLLFLGDRLQPLLHAYEDAAQCLSEGEDAITLFDALRSSEKIMEFYEPQRNGEQVSITMRDSVFRQAGHLFDDKFQLTVTRGPALSSDAALSFSRIGCAVPPARGRLLGAGDPLAAGNGFERGGGRLGRQPDPRS